MAILKRRYILRRFRAASEQLLKSYLELPYPFHLYQNSATLINNINIHTDNYYLYWQAVMDLIKEGTMAVGVFALLCFINPTATLAAAAVFTLITVLMKRFVYPRVRHLTAVSNDAFDKMHITVSDALQSVKEVKTYSVTDRVKAIVAESGVSGPEDAARLAADAGHPPGGAALLDRGGGRRCLSAASAAAGKGHRAGNGLPLPYRGAGGGLHQADACGEADQRAPLQPCQV